MRRQELKTGYYFDCDCPKCLDEEEELKMLAAACPNPECDASILCATMTKCPECEADITDEHKQLYNDVTEQTIAQLGEMCSFACKYNI